MNVRKIGGISLDIAGPIAVILLGVMLGVTAIHLFVGLTRMYVWFLMGWPWATAIITSVTITGAAVRWELDRVAALKGAAHAG